MQETIVETSNKVVITSMWKVIGDSLCEGKKPFVKDELVQKFISYFSNETRKGIAVMGGVGVGKSLNFIIYQRIRASFGEGMSVLCLDVKEIEHTYKLKGQIFVDELINVPELIINDIGTDNATLKNFGTHVSLIDEIISLRYVKWQKLGGAHKTHISSNLSAKDFKDIYGDRITDRLNEMFNIINVPDTQPSYRI